MDPLSHHETNGLILGADGFLFHTFEKAIEQLCRADVPSDLALSQWASMFEKNYAYCRAKGVKYLALIVPERHVVYADKLPPGIAISAQRAYVRLLAAIDPAMRDAIVYPQEELTAAREGGDVFYKTDEHLNRRGNYTCYRAVIDRLQHDVPLRPAEWDSLKINPARRCGNLGIRLDEEPLEDHEFWQPSQDIERIARTAEGHGPVEVFAHRDPSLPRAIILGDSNLDELRHILVPHFSRTVIVYFCQQVFLDLVRTEQPDVVLQIMAESRLGRSSFEEKAKQVPLDFSGYCREWLPPGPTLLSIDFGLGGKSEPVKRQGWSHTEPTHTWATGTSSVIELPPPAAADHFRLYPNLTLRLDVRPLHVSLWPHGLPPPQRQCQRLVVSVGRGGSWLELERFAVAAEASLMLRMPRTRWSENEPLLIRLDHPDAFRPADEGFRDQRSLSIAIRRLVICLSA